MKCNNGLIDPADPGTPHRLTTTFTIKVTEVNDAPIATDVDLGSIAEDGQIVIVEGDLIAASSDPENHNLTVNRCYPDSGTRSVNALGKMLVARQRSDYRSILGYLSLTTGFQRR
ncbi:Ig-like domain-containing protein [Vibrio chagasii]|nr:Ig-like domain-containing protein [Vibrio chagasii]